MTNLISWTFVIFLGVALLVHYLVPKKGQWVVILVANLAFYAFSGVQNFVFILISALTSFFGAAIVEPLPKKSKAPRRLVLAIFLAINLGVLLYLKHYLPIKCSLVLPLGISFYTFSVISYFMDVYNKKYKRETNFFRYLTFVSFFPQLISGPINRYNLTGESLKKARPFDFENIKSGLLLFLFGAMKKYCIADLLSDKMAPILDQGYTNVPGALCAFAILVYAIWQYADFSGGIDMVMGVAKLFGVDMQPNFRQPYFSVSLADFWRRWHISLGLWMRDYVFYPLALTKLLQRLSKAVAGKTPSPLSKHLARSVTGGVCNIAVFFLVGVWHGPQLHYVAWGLYNGIVIALSDALKPFFEKINKALRIPTASKGMHVFRIVRTFFIVCVGWYFDRIESVRDGLLYLKRTFFDFGNVKEVFSVPYLKAVFGGFTDIESRLVIITIASILVFVNSVYCENGLDLWARIKRKPLLLRFTAFWAPIILIILSFSFSPGNPVFMYAQF